MLNYQRVDDIGNYPKAVPLKGVFGNGVYHLNISDSTKPIFFLEENIMLGSAVPVIYNIIVYVYNVGPPVIRWFINPIN